MNVMKLKKFLLIALSIVLLLIAAYEIAPGFMKNPGVFPADYRVSDDGSSMETDISVMSSIGYVRRAETTRQPDGTLNVDFYYAFGGINGSIGAKSTYTLPIYDDTTSIAFYCGDGYRTVLVKNADTGDWERA